MEIILIKDEHKKDANHIIYFMLFIIKNRLILLYLLSLLYINLDYEAREYVVN